MFGVCDLLVNCFKSAGNKPFLGGNDSRRKIAVAVIGRQVKWQKRGPRESVWHRGKTDIRRPSNRIMSVMSVSVLWLTRKSVTDGQGKDRVLPVCRVTGSDPSSAVRTASLLYFYHCTARTLVPWYRLAKLCATIANKCTRAQIILNALFINTI